jgi:SAM-dependent methyltransferase
MAELNISRAHSDEWYDNLAQNQSGYYYPWQSEVGQRNGETAFLEILEEHLTADTRVLEVGCGHGDLALNIASSCHSVVAYDRVPAYINIAKSNQASSGTENVEFVCHNAWDGSAVNLPAEPNIIDLIIGRRAPLHWLTGAKDVCRPGAVLLALCPMEEPIPAWSSKLPPKLHYENSGRHTGHGSIHQSVENRLHQASLTLDSGWGFDVPEVFSDPEELYRMMTWGLPPTEVPPYSEISYKVDGIYDKYAEAQGIVMRHCRFLFRAVVP